MAHGYFMESGKVAVLVTAGAGTTNLLTGVVGAWADSTNLILLVKNLLNNIKIKTFQG